MNTNTQTDPNYVTIDQILAYLDQQPKNIKMVNKLSEMKELEQKKLKIEDFTRLAVNICKEGNCQNTAITPEGLCQSCHIQLEKEKTRQAFEEKMKEKWTNLLTELCKKDPKYHWGNNKHNQIEYTINGIQLRIIRDTIYKTYSQKTHAIRITSNSDYENKFLKKDFGNPGLANSLHKAITKLSEKILEKISKELSEKEKEQKIIQKITKEFPTAKNIEEESYRPTGPYSGKLQKTGNYSFEYNKRILRTSDGEKFTWVKSFTEDSTTIKELFNQFPLKG